MTAKASSDIGLSGKTVPGPAFSFYEYNPRRASRGAEAVRMRVTDEDGFVGLLWMSERDIRRNMMAFGPCAELDKALAAYRGERSIREAPQPDKQAVPESESGGLTSSIFTAPPSGDRGRTLRGS